jgi:hypothetical protein
LDEHFDKKQQRNIISWTSIEDRKMWSWTDSVVFPLWQNYVYKEWKEANEKNLEFLRKKYILLMWIS